LHKAREGLQKGDSKGILLDMNKNPHSTSAKLQFQSPFHSCNQDINFTAQFENLFHSLRASEKFENTVSAHFSFFTIAPNPPKEVAELREEGATLKGEFMKLPATPKRVQSVSMPPWRFHTQDFARSQKNGLPPKFPGGVRLKIADETGGAAMPREKGSSHPPPPE